MIKLLGLFTDPILFNKESSVKFLHDPSNHYVLYCFPRLGIDVCVNINRFTGKEIKKIIKSGWYIDFKRRT